jgi:hypothetical protein
LASKVDPSPQRKELICIYKVEIERVAIGADDNPTRIAILPEKSCTCCLYLTVNLRCGFTHKSPDQIHLVCAACGVLLGFEDLFARPRVATEFLAAS